MSENIKKGKKLVGVVVSDKMKDTVVVSVERYIKHPKYGKYIRHKKRYKAHNPGNTKKIGEKTEIQETKPISKDKRFIVIS
ncbi:MAG: 30S ribosomal protein S17 [Candidatus Zambryskibacteria bacterium CG_4_9_14_3_um_filter_40_16]|uniref:Small ribosomal subunit protein uS17 n=2 Tax=Candidatus Zambryskiibacteriota TaxID=1817925 RepID=A0A2H0K696_9BACT|nr:MAG: 30S ribosomal protein S17 [Candidatus Zambryskibacteria bacterium CG11_big_fil_rev_8_21_14_0_20_40_24]PJA33737.1 MAG: 30S ribosomal protein S17 [Candidatus Zambryskibacteria bacterium CG_4_9_14_3_um_filter_40_16]